MGVVRRSVTWANFSLVRWVIWAAIVPVAWYLGWLNIVGFVAVCSLYANIASDFAAWRADRNPEFEEIKQQIDALRQDLRNQRV